MKGSLQMLCFWMLFLAASCQSPQSPPAGASSSGATVTFQNPLPRWAAFFEKTFGKAPGPPLVGDFNGDGRTDVAARVGSKLAVFHDTEVQEPKEWELIDADEGVEVTIQPAAFAIERIPQLKGELSAKQSVFVVGNKFPIVIFWLAGKSAYAWQQEIPSPLRSARDDAAKRFGTSFGLTKNNLFGLGEGFHGEQKLVEQFVGDFDGDGKEDFLAARTTADFRTELHLYKAGSTPPITQQVDYAGTKAAVHLNPKLKTLSIPDFDGTQKVTSVETKGSYIEIWNPEKSGVVVLFDEDWKMYWVSD